MRQLSPVLAAAPPGVVLALGEEVCADFKHGSSVTEVAEVLGRDGRVANFSGSEAAIVIGAAVPVLCPQYRSRLDA